MKAKELAKWLLKEPDLDVVIFDGNTLVDLNTMTICEIDDKNLFDKNDDKGLITINGDCIKDSKFNRNVMILSYQKNYNEEH